MKNRKFINLTKIACAAAVLAIAAQAGSADAQQRYTLLTSAPGGSWYPMAVGAAELFNEKMKGTNWNAEGGAGGAVNNHTLAQGKVDCAFTSTDFMKMARLGEPPFKTKDDQSKFRSVMLLPISHSHWVVLKNSPYKALGDLKGKRIAVGRRGSAANRRGPMMLEAYGMTTEDVQLEFLSEDQSAKALTDGRIDAFIEFVSPPSASILELVSRAEIRLLPVPHGGPEAKKMKAKYPSLTPATIPANAYKGIDYEVDAWGVPGSWMCLSTVPEEVVYQQVKLVHDNMDRLIKVHKAFKKFDLKMAANEMAATTTHALHPGAARAYKELGLLK